MMIFLCGDWWLHLATSRSGISLSFSQAPRGKRGM